jgi:hypothetical protein
VDWTVNDYCGNPEPGLIPGAVRYHVEASWESETYFMSLVGFDRIPLRSVATAEYLPLVDLYASDVSELGLMKTANQSIFGPDQTRFGSGDPYANVNSPWYSELYGAYTYRIRIPADYEDNNDSLRVEIFDPDTANTNRSTWDNRYYRNSTTYPGQIEYRLYGVDGSSTTNSGDPSWGKCTSATGNNFDEWLPNACVIRPTPWQQTGSENPNPGWFVRVDETRNTVGWYDGDQTNYTSNRQYNTETLYRLFYLKQEPDGTLHEVDLAYYIGKPDNGGFASPTGMYDAAWAQQEAIATDLKWVSPGAEPEDRMPAFDGSQKGCVFNELIGLSGTQSSQINQPDPDYCVSAEPVTKVEDCDAYRQQHFGAREDFGYTTASLCGPSYGDTPHNFVINLKKEVPGIYVDPNNGLRDIYIQVRGLDGASENGYEFWAGPSPDEDSSVVAPADVNARQLYILGARSKGVTIHNSQGVGVFAMGYMPMNSNTNAPVDIPIAYLGPEFAGQQMYIQMFDPDSGAEAPIVFYFDTMPQTDWAVCLQGPAAGYNTCSGLGLGTKWDKTQTARIPFSNDWQTPPYTFMIPSESTGQPFYGGRLYARYRPGANDTYVWKVTIESRPYLVH